MLNIPQDEIDADGAGKRDSLKVTAISGPQFPDFAMTRRTGRWTSPSTSTGLRPPSSET